MSIQFSDIITQMINNSNKHNFEEIFNATWNNCFQWSMLEQYCVFHTASPEILTLEMYGIWTSLYYNKNIRDDISEIHTRYQGNNLENVADRIIEDLWKLYSNIYFEYYTEKLSETYGDPYRNIPHPSYNKLRQIGDIILNEFTPNPKYNFNAPCFMPISYGNFDNPLYLASY